MKETSLVSPRGRCKIHPRAELHSHPRRDRILRRCRTLNTTTKPRRPQSLRATSTLCDAYVEHYRCRVHIHQFGSYRDSLSRANVQAIEVRLPPLRSIQRRHAKEHFQQTSADDPSREGFRCCNWRTRRPKPLAHISGGVSNALGGYPNPAFSGHLKRVFRTFLGGHPNPAIRGH
jgi:hypothetical protein